MKHIKIFTILATLILVPLSLMRLYHTRNPLPILLQSLPIPSTILGPPKGYVYAKEHYPDQYMMIFPAQETDYPPFPIDPTITSKKRSEAFVLSLNHARVYGNNGLIITEEDQVLADTAIDWVPSVKHHKIFRKNKLPKVTYCDEKIAVIASKSADCFFHWMFDILPKLELLKKSNLSFDKIYLNPLKFPFQKETIAYLFQQMGWEESKIIWASEKSHIHAKELIIPSLPGGMSSQTTPWACAFIKEHFLKNSPPHNKKIYISRRMAPTRKIVNEEELIAALNHLGFEEVVLEKLSLFEQASLFASGQCIVAPHGAGLTNLVFCQEKTCLIEIFSPHYLNSCYWNLSHDKNLDHTCLLGSQEGLSDLEKKKNDIWIDVNAVLSHLPL